MIEICTLLFLGANAICDIRKREVSLPLIGILAVCGISGAIWKHVTILERILPMGIGLLMVGFSILSQGGLGMGDALLLTALGTVLELPQYLVMLCIGFLLSAFWAAGLMTLGKKGRNAEFPMVPFFLAGYVGGILLC
jgi:Flp pilus assembly protein protease CpaA